MKKMSKVSVMVAVAMMSLGSLAQAGEGNMWELWTGGIGSVDFVSAGTSQTNINFLSTAQKIAPSFGYNVGDGFELMLSPVVGSPGSTPATSTIQVMGGVAYNFMGEWDDSMFIKAMAGIKAVNNGTTTNSGLAWTAGIGKRFKIVENVSWAPELDFLSVAALGTTAATTTFSIVPFQITVQM